MTSHVADLNKGDLGCDKYFDGFAVRVIMLMESGLHPGAEKHPNGKGICWLQALLLHKSRMYR